MTFDSTKRFSDRVENYIKYRPRYPRAIIPHLESHINLTADTGIADVGSGTGILTELFLDNGNSVFGIEPNEPMRAAAEELLSAYDRFASVDGTAEATTLSDQSVDLIVAGQAFHWFDPPKARAEFARILKPGGHVALIWNSRLRDGAFMGAYEEILFSYADDYKTVGDRNVKDENIAVFFDTASGVNQSGVNQSGVNQSGVNQLVIQETFENEQKFDFEGLKGRALSSSYSPAPGTPKHEPFIEQLEKLFAEHQVDGKVRIEYRTRVYLGTL